MTTTDSVREELLLRVHESMAPQEILRAPELRALAEEIKTLAPEERSGAGKALNELKQTLQAAVEARQSELEEASLAPIDVTAPWDTNAALPNLLPTEYGTQHPITTELERIIDIFTRMGFDAHESRQLDDDWNMFGALNFPEGHPARDGYDTFRTEEGFIPPAHTSTMQNRVLKEGKVKLKAGGQIASISYGRVFRNEDVDPTHEHTFYQQEGVFVSRDASLAQMLGTLRAFFEEYYGQKLGIKTQPGYFPFVEPGLEFMIEKPASIGGKPGDFLEMLGCGMIHPNVLSAAGIDPTQYRGFAWGGGVERMIMLKYGIEDLRHFESGKLAFSKEVRMIISVNWLKKYTNIDGSIDELAALIGSRLVEIEEVVDLGKKYEGVIIAKVVECSPLEGSDHLNVTKIDDGGVVDDIERDENGLVQVVCGAPNVKAGLTVAWLPPRVTVPATYADKEPFVLSAKPLRGVVSNGMLASAKELDLWDDHTGILELEDERQAGERFAKAYELDDYLLDIENKSLTHRPDTFGIVGFAREVAGVQGNKFTTPEKLTLEGVNWRDKTGDIPTPKVTIDNPELSARYQAVVLTNVDATVQLSPLEIRTYLSRVGVKSHSAVVDVTNYMMMVTGQPLHAFDYDKLKAVNSGEIDIHVRTGREGEKLLLLDDREIELTTNDIVIANGEKAVALAGAMGGKDTEIDDTTTTVLLESASFNLYNLRNTQMRHGIFSEAITRFTKGQPPALTEPVLAGAVDLLAVGAGAERASDVADAYPGKADQQTVRASQQFINAMLGSDYSMDEMTTTLVNVGFEVDVEAPYIIVATAPYWRTDIHIAEDIAEEIGRLNGFDTITPTLPKRDFTAVSPDPFDEFRAQVRKTLARAGVNEVLTYSFVHGDVIAKAGQNVEHAYRIVNSISPDLQYYRLTLTPSLLGLVHPNSKAGYDNFALYEMNKTHSKVFGMSDDNTPKETDLLALVVRRKSDASGYFAAKRLLDYLASSLHMTLVYSPIDAEPGYDESAPYDYKRSAMVSDKATGEYIGIIGEYKTAVKKAFKLEGAVAGFELDPRALHKASQAASNGYEPLGKYPSTDRDVCYKVASAVRYADIYNAALSYENNDVRVTVDPLDIYQAEGEDTKNVTLRFTLEPLTKTLSSDEANAIMNTVSENVIAATKATIV